MSAGWVAAATRGRGLARRCLGTAGARQLGSAPSLGAAVDALAETPYRREVRSGMGLAEAQRAVAATTLWHLRVLAGWAPPLGAEPLRLLAAGFEVANVTGHLARLAGRPAGEPFHLGSLASAWGAVSATRTPGEVRAALRHSVWGDPGSEELGAVRLGLQLVWARRVFDGVPGAGGWAVAAAGLVVARALAAGARPALGRRAVAEASRLLGPRWTRATSLPELAPLSTPPAARALRAVAGPEDLWRAEVAWWRSVGAEAGALAARPRPDTLSVVGSAALLLTDAWRVRGALGAAAVGAGGVGRSEALDAVA